MSEDDWMIFLIITFFVIGILLIIILGLIEYQHHVEQEAQILCMNGVIHNNLSVSIEEAARMCWY